MMPIPPDLAALPHLDVVNQEFFLRDILTIESNAHAAEDAGITQPDLRTYIAADKSRFGWSWKANASFGNVQAYPEVKCGRKPWTGPAGSTTPLLPRQLKDLSSLTADFGYRYDATGSGNAAFDLWLLSNKDGGPAEIVGEVMVWLDRRGSIQPAGTPNGGDANWDVWTSSGGSPLWPYFAFVSKVPRAAGTADLRGMLNHLVSRGFFADTVWVASVEFGTEFIDGEGWCAVDQFRVTVS
jgi:hypothetical protein